MKSKSVLVLSILLFLGIIFSVTGCQDFLIQRATNTTIKINLDLSKLVKTSRNQSIQEIPEYLLKIAVYDSELYQPNSDVEKLPLITQSEKKVDINGLVQISLEVPIDSKVIFIAKLYELIDENTESKLPFYAGKSDVITVKPKDNKVHLVLSKINADIDVDIEINSQSNYKVEHYQQNIEDEGYSLVEGDTENKTGTIGTETEAVAKLYEGFSVNPFEQKTILSNGLTTVKIYYTRNVYSVTFNANGGILSENSSQKVKYGGKSTEPTEPTKEGYSFAYWYTSKDNGITEDISYNFLTPVTSDVTLHAKWTAGSDIVYKVEHYQQNIEDEGYSLVEGDTENKTGTIGTETEAVAKLYEGFSVNPFEQKTILSNGLTTVKIYYTRNVYTVTFNANGGILSENNFQKVKYGGKSTESRTPTKEGHEFEGWYTSSDAGVTLDTKFDFSVPITSDVTLYAKWTAGSDIVYKVEHYQQNIEDEGYSLVEGDIENKTGTIGTETEAIAKLYEGFSVNPFEQKTILSNGLTTVKIYYTRNVYTVTFNANGGILSENNFQKVKYGGKSTESRTPTKEGHEFEGWYTSSDAGVTLDTKFDFSVPITSDVTLYAKWTAGSDIVYKVEHYQQNIEDEGYSLVEGDIENKTGTIGTETEAIAKLYEGFSVNPFEQKTILSNGLTTVKIYYTRNVYTVTFNANGGILSENNFQKVKYGGKSTEPTEPTKEGYSFAYWYTSKDNGITEDISYNFLTPVTSDVTLHAKWTAGSDIVYKVEHYQQNIEDEGYSLVEGDTETKTGTIGTETEAVAKLYEGFSVNPFEQKTILSNGLTTVKIYYTRNVYTVTFNANGGILSENNFQKVKYGGKSTEPTEPTKEGYEFDAWYTSFDAGVTLDTKFDFSVPITRDVTLYAKWKLAERFVFVQGASINGAITADGYTTSEIFKEGAIVSIPNFYISDHEVTQAEYKAIMGTWPDESVINVEQVGIGDNFPAHHVSWFDALVYCNKRSFQEGLTPCYTINGSTNPDKWGDVPRSTTDENYSSWVNVTCDFQANGYRLPTSAEWEYAARGGNELKGFQYQYSGSNSIDMVAWCSENSDGTSHEVKTKQPNELDLYDMSGNLWEWCWELRENLESHRINRGGNWYDPERNCFVSFQNDYFVYERHNNIGFRVVRTATEQSQGDVYSQGISLNGKIYDKTSEVVVVPSDTVAQIAMTDDSSWSSYLEDDVDLWYKGVFLRDRKVQLSPFAISRFEVTQELYEAVIGSNPSHF